MLPFPPTKNSRKENLAICVVFHSKQDQLRQRILKPKCSASSPNIFCLFINLETVKPYVTFCVCTWTGQLPLRSAVQTPPPTLQEKCHRALSSTRMVSSRVPEVPQPQQGCPWGETVFWITPTCYSPFLLLFFHEWAVGFSRGRLMRGG